MAVHRTAEEPFLLRVGGEWIETGDWADVIAPYDGSVVGVVATGGVALVDAAVASAARAFESADFPAHARADVLDRTSELIAANAEQLAQTIACECGKPIKQSRVEVARAASTFRFSAVEARKLAGEAIPMDATATGAGKLGLTIRVPLGVVGAITPFNFPLNLGAHKLGPAIAAGNSVVLKPATATPLTSIRLVELILEAGAPVEWVQIVCGSGSEVGERLVSHPGTAAISFTGSADVGWGIRRKVPHKRVMLELGSNAPLIVGDDADWRRAAEKAAVHGYSYAGQSCISVQRVLVHEAVAESFTDAFVDAVEALKVGDPLHDDTDVGPLIDAASRQRVIEWIEEAEAGGARLLTGGTVNADGTLQPAVMTDVPRDAKAWCQEAFGPVVALRSVPSIEAAFAEANDTRYGLQAAVYTASLATALRAAYALDYGAVLINEMPTFRTDQQPYGGVKDSGNTREGPAYAIRELSEERLVTFQI